MPDDRHTHFLLTRNNGGITGPKAFKSWAFFLGETPGQSSRKVPFSPMYNAKPRFPRPFRQKQIPSRKKSRIRSCKVKFRFAFFPPWQLTQYFYRNAPPSDRTKPGIIRIKLAAIFHTAWQNERSSKVLSLEASAILSTIHPMKLPGFFLIFFYLVQGARGEEELKAIIQELQANFGQLEGYQATYESKTEAGKTATLRQGEDYESGWAYTIGELRDSDGTLLGRQETWSTDGDQYLVKAGEEFYQFNGISRLIEQVQRFTSVLKLDPSLPKIKRLNSNYLTSTHVFFAIQVSSQGPVWLTNIERLVSATDKEVTLDWGELGNITVDRQSGLLTSQTIKVKEGVREMKLTKWVKNPGKENIAALMKLDPEKAVLNGDVGTVMVTPMLYQSYQALIHKIDENPEFGDTLEKTLLKTEDQLVSFLHQQPLSEERKKRIISMMATVDKIGADLEKSAAKQGQNLDRRQLLSNANLAKKIAKKIEHGSAKDIKQSTRNACLKTALGERLKAKGAIEEKARLLIEDAILAAYFRTEFEKAILLYLRN